MSRTITLALAALALTAVSGCDELTQRAVDAQAGSKALQAENSSTEGSGQCVTCAKFRTRPPTGINAPPAR